MHYEKKFEINQSIKYKQARKKDFQKKIIKKSFKESEGKEIK